MSFLQQIAVILQHEIQNSKTKVYIASFQMALELGYLKGGYVNFWFCCSGFVLQDHCNLLYLSMHYTETSKTHHQAPK